MAKSFSLYRVRILMSLDLSQKWKNYAWLASVLFMCVLIMLLPPLFYENYHHLSQLAQYAAIPIVLLLGSSFYTSAALKDFGEGNKGVFAFMTPASMPEKIVSSLLINFLFLIPFLIFFWQIHYTTLFIANNRIPAEATKYIPVSKEVAVYVSYCYFLFHSVVFAGSIYFSKSSYVKTIAFTIAGALFISILNTSFAKFLAGYPLMLGAFPLGGWSVVRDSSLKVYYVSSADQVYPWQYILPVLMLIGLYAVAYLRLKEKQI